MKKISSEIKIYNRNFKNRVLIQPMEGCDGTASGGIGELTHRRYLRFAESGAAVIWFEAVAVCEEGRANPRQLWLKKDNVEEYSQLLLDIRSKSAELFGYSPVIIMQMTHSGRYSKPHGIPEPIVASRKSEVEKGKEDQPYRIITDEECDILPSLYAEAARLAAEAGFDGVDVKCCHGYLLNDFLSAYDRPGKYGGSFENRTSLYFNCIDAVKEVLEGTGLFVTTRLSGYDGFAHPYGFAADEKNEIDLTETKKILSILQQKGVELVNITIGNPYVVPHINRPFVGGPEDGDIGVKRVTDVTWQLQKEFPELKIVLSALTYPGKYAIDHAEKCLEDGVCSLVGFGRMAFAYPDFYADYLKNGKLDSEKVCVKCGNCSKMMRAGGVAGCPVRDKEIYLPLFKEYMGR